MSRVTRFAARDPGPAARMAGFLAHLRDNGLRLGVEETELSLLALTHADASDPQSVRRALRPICVGCREDSERFDDLFEAFWLNGGRVVQKAIPPVGRKSACSLHRADEQWSAGGSGRADESTAGTDPVSEDGKGKLVASDSQTSLNQDLRELTTPEDIGEAERIARRLGESLRDQRSRRRMAARRGDRLHFRKLIRQSLSTGGEPLRLPLKRRPDRPVRIVALCDVSGSMTCYARAFLAFLAGMLRADNSADAYLFHTRLVRVADALRDRDVQRALQRLSLLAHGFGGGSKIGGSLHHFARTYARRFVDRRTVVLIMSDGYDTDPPELLSSAMNALRRRGCRIIWLNPLKSWKSYDPVARGMAAALPFLDLFHTASSLEDLAGLERLLVRL